MADRDGLGDLPLFDTEVRPVREFVAQEQRQEDDYQYITRMYSALARQILDLIEDICDQMEYEGSRMFDEYMDRTMLLAMVDKIYYKYEGNTPEYIKKELKECADLVTFLDSKMLAINEEVRSIREENKE